VERPFNPAQYEDLISVKSQTWVVDRPAIQNCLRSCRTETVILDPWHSASQTFGNREPLHRRSDADHPPFVKLPPPKRACKGIHPSIQWRYSPNRALASSIEVP
jgi:hypothetical protein